MSGSKDVLSFEDALTQLETITRQLESGQESLEESMKLYEKGIQLKELCEKKLKEAEGKWQVLRNKASEALLEDFQDENES
jgi:exodeoxyribonuclease VII small subunit